MALVLVVALSTAGSAAGADRASVAPASADDSADFNGDGFGDLAIGSSMDYYAGAVFVLYGSADGLSAAGAQLVTQDTAGVSGTAEDEDFFGSALATGDFNGDGFSDLAVGSPGETLGFKRGAGVVHVLFGSPEGLTGSGSQLWSQGGTGISGKSEAEDYLGSSLAVGDFGYSSHDDLAIGVPGESIGGIRAAGAVELLYGSDRGLTSVGSQLLHQNSPGVPGTAETGDGFGRKLAAGDVGRDSRDDLIVGVPDEAIGAALDAGAVQIFYGVSAGLTVTGSQWWSQDSSGVSGVAEAGDRFGSGLAVANFGRTAYADVAIAAAGEALGDIEAAGQVHVLFGSPAGVTATRSQVWNQASPGILGTPEPFDQFGLAAAGSFTGGSYSDLVVGVPNESVGANTASGAVYVIRGASAGLTAQGSQLWTQDSPGIADAVEYNDGFGGSLAAGDFGNGTQGDLAIGAAAERTADNSYIGMVHVLSGSSSGLTGTDSRAWTTASPGMPGGSQFSSFGVTLAAG